MAQLLRPSALHSSLLYSLQTKHQDTSALTISFSTATLDSACTDGLRDAGDSADAQDDMPTRSPSSFRGEFSAAQLLLEVVELR